MARKAFDQAVLDHLDSLAVEQALASLGLVWRIDDSFRPRKSPLTKRLNVTVGVGVFELLANGPKWFDTRARKGGIGAISLTMHLLGVSFVSAVMRASGARPPETQRRPRRLVAGAAGRVAMA